MNNQTVFVDFDRDAAGKKLYEVYKQKGKYEEVKKIYEVPTGENVSERWLVTQKKFKPLRDLLGQTKDPVTKLFYENNFVKHSNVEHFIMSPEMALEVQRLTKHLIGKPQEVAKLLPKAMTPYSKLCVELPLTEEVSSMRKPVEEHTAKVQRIGAFITTYQDEVTKDLMFTFTPYYEFQSGYVNSSYVLLVHKNNETFPGFLPLQFSDFGEMVWNATLDPSILSHADKNGVPVETLYKQLFEDTNAFQLMASEAVEEVPTLFFAWLVLLNSKSGITKTKVNARIPHPKLGKRERARRGRSAYTVVSLTDTEDVDSEGLVTHKNIVNAHRVRGHFKAKKWGIYWWRPHIRGVGELKDREGYVVTT